jgi:alpha-1,3-rhamnosyl/mannosyltransferase
MDAPLRIAVDARCLNTAHLRGMGKYLYEMMSHADALADIDWRLYGERHELPFNVPALRRASTKIFDLRGYRFHTWEQIGLPQRARAGLRADLLHATATTLPWWQPVPTVVTLHDTLPWQALPAGGFERWYWERLVPAALQRCAAVITISESSRRDIEALWPGLVGKLTVIPHGIADSYLNVPDAPRPQVVSDAIGDARYLLYVGGAAEHKRFDWAVRSFAAVADHGVQLLAMGFAAREVAAARELVPEQLRGLVHFLPFVAEEAMPQLYRHAIATLYPTRYEGFGFPAVESQAVGTPVLFSAVGSLAELAGPEAVVLPLDERGAWEDALRQILVRRDHVLSDARPARWAGRFSWEQSAAAHLDVYRSASRRQRA